MENERPPRTVVIAPSFRYFVDWERVDNPGERINPRDPRVTVLTRPHDEYRLRGIRHTEETPLRVIWLNMPYGQHWDTGGVLVGLRRAGVTEVLDEQLRPGNLF